MKTYLLHIMLFVSLLGYTQNGINYKALIKDTNGNAIAKQTIDVKFQILQDAVHVVYEETHTTTTDNNGIFIVNIGEGTQGSFGGDFADINWGGFAHFLNVNVDYGNGLTDLGTTEFKVVPYAIHAANVKGLEPIDEGNGMGWRLVGKDPENYGDIGEGAIDLSHQTVVNLPRGVTGNQSFASGVSSTASGFRSTALGATTTASGTSSTAMGILATASGNYSTALGSSTEALGTYSTAMGFSTEASALSTTAMGSQTIASENYAVAMGNQTAASGIAATAMGSQTIASEDYAVAMGNQTTASGIAATAMGEETIASGDYAAAIGKTTEAIGDYSIALGVLTDATGEASTAIGLGTEATAYSTIAIGNNSTASGAGATAIGSSTLASGRISIAMGSETTARAYAQTVIGRYNIPFGNSNSWINTDPLFTIGNGNVNNRSNALTVLKNGNLGLGTSQPTVAFQISTSSGTDASLNNGSGYVVLGSENGRNLVLDNNEIIARNDGNTATLQLQEPGGDVNVGGTLAHSSDRRLKKDIEDLEYGLNEVLQFAPKQYFWKNRPNQKEKSLGLIAQDVQTIIKNIVHTANDDQKTLSVSYTELIPVLIKAIQEQQEIINNQNTKIDGLTSEVTVLKSMNERIKILEQQSKTSPQ